MTFITEITILKGGGMLYRLKFSPLFDMPLDTEYKLVCLKIITSIGMFFRHKKMPFAAAHSTSLQLI